MVGRSKYHEAIFHVIELAFVVLLFVAGIFFHAI